MNSDPNPAPLMSTPEIYSIKVRGKLANAWADWFNGTLVNFVHLEQQEIETLMTCRVRDQAELLGILKQLNALNLPLVEVILDPQNQKNQGENRHEI